METEAQKKAPKPKPKQKDAQGFQKPVASDGDVKNSKFADVPVDDVPLEHQAKNEAELNDIRMVHIKRETNTSRSINTHYT